MASELHDTVYNGSCHCKFVTFTVELNLSTPNDRSGAIITKCNCTICQKAGVLLSTPQPGTLKIITPSKGLTEMSDYTFDQCRIHHYFCPKCGVQCFFEGDIEIQGNKIHVQRINALTVDGREDGKEMVELKTIKVKYYAGRDNEWTRGLADEPYEGGVW